MRGRPSLLNAFKRVRWRTISKLRGDHDPRLLVRYGLQLGDDVYFAGGVMVDPGLPWLVSIGDRATLAPRVVVLAHDASTRRTLGYARIGRVHIGAGAFVGAGSIVLPGVTIGDGAIIGAGSVVRHDVPPGMVAVGNPARVIKAVDDYLADQREEMDRWPHFSEAYTIRGGVTEAQRAEMLAALENGPAFIR
jgi:maltose O-acetyltransferase